MQDVRARGELLHRISYETSGRALEAMISAGIQTGFGDEWIKFGATSEHTVDGSFSERTMALSTPYPGVTPPYKGNVTETQDDAERVGRARAPRRHPGELPRQRRRRHRHVPHRRRARAEAACRAPTRGRRSRTARCVNPRPGARASRRIGAVPALFTTYAYYNPDKFVYYGEEMMKSCMAFRSLLDAGVYAAAGSDFSPGPFAPLMGIQGMVTRKGWDGKIWGANQRISVERGHRRQHLQRRVGVAAKRRSRARSPPASSPTTSCWPTTRTPWTSRRSRTSRSCARWWAARPPTRRSARYFRS